MLINKKRIITFIVIFIISMAITSYATEDGIITGGTVRLREEPSLNGKLLTLLSLDEKVEVLSLEGDWYKVTYKKYTGYIHKDYVKVSKKLEEETTNNEKEETENANTKNDDIANENNDKNEVKNEVITVPSEKAIKEDTNVLILPLINSSVVAPISKDTKVTVIEYKNGWTYIISSTERGWIREEKLQDRSRENELPEESEGKNIDSSSIEEEINSNIQTDTNKDNNNTSTNETTEFKERKAYVNVNSVNVRKLPSTSSAVIDGLVMNDEVTIIGEEENWYKVKVNGQQGYISKKYLSDTKTKVTSRSSSVERTEEQENIKNDVEEDIQKVNSQESSKGEQIVEYAKTFLGSKYVSGGSSPKTGFDCSGFTCYVYKNFGYTLNRASSAQADNGVEVSKADLKLGDLVLFSQGNRKIGHVGIYIGNNNFIHSANPKKGVVITSLSNSYYLANYVCARRIIN